MTAGRKQASREAGRATRNTKLETTTETIMSAAAATTMEEPSTTTQQHQQQTSLRFLRLQHDFQTMVKTGIGCVDEEVGCRSSLTKAEALTKASC